MTFTAADLAAINTAIASGELTIRADSGRMVTFRTIDELLKARAVILAELPTSPSRPYPRHQLADFSD